MHIQQLTTDDVADVYSIGKSEPAFEVREGGCFWTQEQLKRWVEGGEDVLLAAKEGNKILGFALSTFHRPTGKATWENLYIHPDARNKGIGNALAKELVRQLQSKGATYRHHIMKSDSMLPLVAYGGNIHTDIKTKKGGVTVHQSAG